MKRRQTGAGNEVPEDVYIEERSSPGIHLTVTHFS
jgi:hypothetical protein